MPEGIYFELGRVAVAAVVGGASALFVYNIKTRRDRADQLRGILLKIGRKFYYDSNTVKVFNCYHDKIVDVCTAYERSILAPRNKKRFRKLFFSLIAHDPITSDRHCTGAYPERSEAISIIEEMLRFLGYPKAKPPAK